MEEKRIVIIATHAGEDPERATFPFVMGNASFRTRTTPSPVTGLMYSQTTSASGVTSKKCPSVIAQISVLPFGRRCAPEPMWLKNP